MGGEFSLCPGGSTTEPGPEDAVSGDGDAEKSDQRADPFQIPARGHE